MVNNFFENGPGYHTASKKNLNVVGKTVLEIKVYL